MTGKKIDRGKLRNAIRHLGNEYVFYVLHDAISLLPESTLCKLIRPYIKLDELRPDDAAEEGLLAEVQDFRRASLAHEYYESFDVSWKNSEKLSLGTVAWIAECRHLLRRCAAEAKKWGAGEVCQAFDVMFDLLDRVDAGDDEILFFADEGGSWMIGIDWLKILPAWFRALSGTADPATYAERVAAILGRHCTWERGKMLATARKIAKPTQRLGLPKA